MLIPKFLLTCSLQQFLWSAVEQCSLNLEEAGKLLPPKVINEILNICMNNLGSRNFGIFRGVVSMLSEARNLHNGQVAFPTMPRQVLVKLLTSCTIWVCIWLQQQRIFLQRSVCHELFWSDETLFLGSITCTWLPFPLHVSDAVLFQLVSQTHQHSHPTALTIFSEHLSWPGKLHSCAPCNENPVKGNQEQRSCAVCCKEVHLFDPANPAPIPCNHTRISFNECTVL